MPMGNSVEEIFSSSHENQKSKNVETDELINVFIGMGYDTRYVASAC